MKKTIILIFILILGICSLSWAPEIPRLQRGEPCSFIFEASDTTKLCMLGKGYLDTELHSLKLIMPAFSATAPTATISIKDPAGSTIYSQAGIAESTTTYIPLSRPLTFGSSYVILLTTTAGTGGGTATVDSWIYK